MAQNRLCHCRDQVYDEVHSELEQNMKREEIEKRDSGGVGEHREV